MNIDPELQIYSPRFINNNITISIISEIGITTMYNNNHRDYTCRVAQQNDIQTEGM